jgi:hypothetical protein
MQSSFQQLEGRYQKELKRSEEFSIEAEKLCSQLLELRQQPTISAKMT